MKRDILFVMVVLLILIAGCTNEQQATAPTLQFQEMETTEPVSDATEPAPTVIQVDNDYIIFREPEEVKAHPFTPEELDDAQAVAQTVVDLMEQEQGVLTFQTEILAFDPMLTDIHIRQKIALSPVPGWNEEDYYAHYISYTLVYSAAYDHSKTFLSDVTRTTIGIHLYRDNETDPWHEESSGVPTAEYSHTLLNKDALSEWVYDDKQILAGYHPTAQEYWLYICDQKTGIVIYETRIVESDPTMQFKESVPQTGAPISPQPGDTSVTWDAEKAVGYPADADCSDLELLEKWLAVEGLTYQDLDERNCDQLILVVAQDDGIQTITVCYERLESGEWEPVDSLTRMHGFTGSNGIAHNRRRNTNTSPAGLWALGTAFGNAEKPNGIQMPWRDITPNSDWVCDANSIYFNTWQERDDPLLESGWDYGDVEHLEDYVTQYAYAVVIEYNTPPYTIPDRGCAIFLHCSRGATGGCIGLNETDMLDILLWLDPKNNPHILITGFQRET